MDWDILFGPAVHEQAKSRECQLRVNVIQAARVMVCGFLVGSYMKIFNLDHYNALLSMVPKFAACPVAVIKKNPVSLLLNYAHTFTGPYGVRTQDLHTEIHTGLPL